MGKASPAVAFTRNEDFKSLDHFPTPPYAVRALCEFLTDGGLDLSGLDALEPATGLGHLALALDEYFKDVWVADIHDWAAELGEENYVFHTRPEICDFLADDLPVDPGEYDWIITNPPFNLSRKFANRAIDLAGRGVALLLRTAFLESRDRYINLFEDAPPSFVVPFAERVGMVRDRVDINVQSATSYSWFIWNCEADTEAIVRNRGAEGEMTRLDWFRPGTRQRLEYLEDYE